MKRYRPLRVVSLIMALFLIFQGLCLAGLMTLKGSSMEPAIKDGSKIWVSSYAKGENPARGDIVAFSLEKGTSVKRVIGLPGEKVSIRNGVVTVTGPDGSQAKTLDEPYLPPGTITGPDGEFPVPGGQYFVLGDNRGASLDSRGFGCIPKEKIIGKVTKVF